MSDSACWLAKIWSSSVTVVHAGNAFTSNSTCPRYDSSGCIEVHRHRDLVFRVELPAPDQRAFPAAEVDTGEIQPADPLVAMAFREPQEQALDLDATAHREEPRHPGRTEIDETGHQHVGIVERLPTRKLVEHFQDRPFGRTHDDPPFVVQPSPNQIVTEWPVEVRRTIGQRRPELADP